MQTLNHNITEKDEKTLINSIRKYEALNSNDLFVKHADLSGLDYFDLAGYFEYLVKLYNR